MVLYADKFTKEADNQRKFVIESDNTETDTVLSDKFNKRREQLRYETYEHLVATGFFTGTYEEYKERTKLGLIGPTQTF